MATLLLVTAGLSGCGTPDDTRDRAEPAAAEASATQRLSDCTLLNKKRTYVPLLRNTLGTGAGLPGSGWHTPLVIQNVDTQNGTTVVLEARTSSGAIAGTACVDIEKGESVVFRPDNPQGSAGVVGIPAVALGNFQGSMVIYSGGPVAVTSFLDNVPISSGLGTPGGLAKSATTATREDDFQGPLEHSYFPVKSGHYGRSTRLFLQSTSDTTSTTLSATLKRHADGQEFTATAVIPARGSIVLEPTQFKRNGIPFPSACNPNTTESPYCLATLHITTSLRTTGVAVEVPISQPVPTLATMNRLAAGELDFHTGMACPMVKNQFPNATGRTSTLYMMNVPPTSQSLTLSLRGTSEPSTPASVNNPYLHTFVNVPSMDGVVASPTTGTMGGLPSLSLASGTITGTAPLGDVVATVFDEGGGRLGGYSCLPISRGQKKVAIPIVKFGFPGGSSPYTTSTGIVVQSVGPATTTLAMTYRCRHSNGEDLPPYTLTRELDGYRSRVFSPNTIAGFPSPSLCTLLIESSVEKIVAIANESSEGHASATPVDTATFEGVWLEN